MTAEQKAKALVEKFKDVIPQWGGDPTQAEQIDTNNAKQCALIAVDEILEGMKCDGFSWNINSYWIGGKWINHTEALHFWQSVRNYIINY